MHRNFWNRNDDFGFRIASLGVALILLATIVGCPTSKSKPIQITSSSAGLDSERNGDSSSNTVRDLDGSLANRGDESHGRALAKEMPTVSIDTHHLMTDSQSQRAATVDGKSDGSERVLDPLAAPAETLPTLEGLRVGQAEEKWTWQRIMMVGPGGPLILDFRVRVGEHSLEQQVISVHQQLKQKFISGENESLRWETALSDPRISGGAYSALRPTTDENLKQLLQMYDRNQDGNVDERELHAYLSRGVSERPLFVVDEANRYRGTNLDNSTVFQQLDADGDGILNENEIEVASSKMSQLDSNADFQVSLAELLPRESDPESFVRQRLSTNEDMFIVVSDSVKNAGWGRTLMKKYSFALGLFRDDWPRTPELFACLDGDLNGELDQREISQVGSQPPTLLIDLQLEDPEDDKTADANLPFFRVASKLSTAPIRKFPNGLQSTVAEHSGYRFEIHYVDPLSRRNVEARARQIAEQLGVTESKGVSAESLARPTSGMGLSPASLDANRDGVVDWLEVQEFERNKSRLTSSNVRIRLVDPPDAWFAWLDENLDEKLTETELQRASIRLRQLLANGEKTLTPEGLPTQLYMIATRVYGDQDPFQSVNLISVGEMPVASNSTENIPKWFTAMDTNGDSQIAMREFLGTNEAFNSMDHNKDGIIDPNEL